MLGLGMKDGCGCCAPTGPENCVSFPFDRWSYTQAAFTLTTAELAAPATCGPYPSPSPECFLIGPRFPAISLPPVSTTSGLISWVFDAPAANPFMTAPAYQPSVAPADWAYAFTGASARLALTCPYAPCSGFPDVELHKGFYCYLEIGWGGNCPDSWNGTQYTRDFRIGGRWFAWFPRLDSFASPVLLYPGDCAGPTTNAGCAVGPVTVTFS